MGAPARDDEGHSYISRTKLRNWDSVVCNRWRGLSQRGRFPVHWAVSTAAKSRTEPLRLQEPAAGARDNAQPVSRAMY